MIPAKYIENTNATKTIFVSEAIQCMLLLEKLENSHVNGVAMLTDSEYTHAINLKCTKEKAKAIVDYINSNCE
jgi:hypothetical protein